jgi:hypothetical protein
MLRLVFDTAAPRSQFENTPWAAQIDGGSLTKRGLDMEIKMMMPKMFAVSLLAVSAAAQSIPVSENLWRLLAQEDTDGDKKSLFTTAPRPLSSTTIMARRPARSRIFIKCPCCWRN